MTSTPLGDVESAERLRHELGAAGAAPVARSKPEPRPPWRSPRGAADCFDRRHDTRAWLFRRELFLLHTGIWRSIKPGPAFAGAALWLRYRQLGSFVISDHVEDRRLGDQLGSPVMMPSTSVQIHSSSASIAACR